MEFNLNYEKNIIDEINQTIHHVLKHKIDTLCTTLTIQGNVTEEPIAFEKRNNKPLEPFQVGDTWGKLFDCAWFLIEGIIPNFCSNETYWLKLDVSGEACLFNKEGEPIKGFTNGSSVFDRSHGEPGKLYYPINKFIKKDGSLSLWVDAGCNDLFGSLQDNGVIISCEIVKRDEQIKSLFYDLETLFSLLQVCDQSSNRYKQLYEGLKTINYLIIYDEIDWLEKAIEITKNLLSERSNNPLNITAVGHAHIDLAWLWPIRETKRKAARTIASVLDLLERDKNFTFGISQPQLLVWLKEEYRTLFDQLKVHIMSGRVECQGGMWIESDTNITGEESLVRQMLYGIKYYQDEFNFRVKNLWLPDVFGYTGSLPQIIKKSGLDYFMTIKLSWNLINRFPYHTFNWSGIDGSSVLCHMPPEGNYNSSILPRVVKAMEDNYQEKHLTTEALALFGIGDGGGGPGEEHVERIKRQHSLHPLPQVAYGRSDTFFEKLAKKKFDFPSWNGELYLENHQGTYTSQANVKMYNRKLEHKLKAIETFLVSRGSESKYKSELETIWKEILLYQFHDILPGSSIKRVYDECLARYHTIDIQLDNLMNNECSAYTTDFSPDHIKYNPLLVEATTVNKFGHAYYIQQIAPLSIKQTNITQFYEEPFYFNGVIETNLLKIQFNQKTGQMSSILDKENNKEILSRPYGNQLCVYQDKGDAWNILDHYRRQTPSIMELIETTAKKYGSVYEITQQYRFKESTLKEVVIIRDDCRIISFNHQLDWKNVGYMLRTSFPLSIDTDRASFDIQFGQISRTRLNNTKIESAQFEVSGHNWVDVSEAHYGVSLMNTGKYGYFIKGDILDINLLRSTNYPCVDGDIDETAYAYQLYLHEGNQNDANVDQIAMEMNTYFPMFRQPIQVNENWLTLDTNNIDYSTIKGAVDDTGIIIRLYEKNGDLTQTNLHLTEEVEQIYLVNLVEEVESELIASQVVPLIFKPFEIITLKIIFKK